MTEDPIITQLRVADEEILSQMENAGDDFEEYNGLVIKRHKLYLKHEKRAKDDTARYLISTISIEWNLEPLLINVILIVSPSVARKVGPGIVPLNSHTL